MSASGTTDLSWLPSDADEQLALGFKIVTNAHKTRVNSLEAEIRSFKAKLSEREEQFSSLQKKNSNLEVQLIEAVQRANQLSDENKQLINTIKKLNRDIERLENLKKAVLNSIQEEHEIEDNHNKYYSADDMLQTTAPRTMLEISGNEDTCQSILNKIVNTDTPNIMNYHFNKNMNMNMNNMNGNKNINKSNISNDDNNNNNNNTFLNKSHDSKTLFRTVKKRLTLDQFEQFVNNITQLKNHKQSREETLKKAQIIFGESNNDLYEEFKIFLLN